MIKLIRLEPSLASQFKINNECIDSIRSGMTFDNEKSVNSLLNQSTTKRTVISRSKDVLLNYIKAFLSETKEMNVLQTVLKILKSNHRNRSSILLSLPTDIMKYVILFVSIEDYCFNILQTCKHFSNNFAPQKAKHIMRDLIKNECTECWSNEPLMLSNNKVNYLDKWELSGCDAWINYDCKQLFKNVKDAQSKVIKNKSVFSSLFLLHFMYKCRYGGIERSSELRAMLLQIISNGGGILGIRYMIVFYSKQFLFNRIQCESRCNSPILYGEMHQIHQKQKVKRTIADLLYEIYDDETFFRFTNGLRKLIDEQEDKLLIDLLNQMMNEYNEFIFKTNME